MGDKPVKVSPRSQIGTGTQQYGRHYFCVTVPVSKLGKVNVIWLVADEVEFTASGGIVFWNNKGTEKPVVANLAFAPGQWISVYAASVLTGGPVAVEYWGENEAT
jgi:hypothetical protein